MTKTRLTLFDRINLLLRLEYVQDSLYRKGFDNHVIPDSYKRIFWHIGLQQSQHIELFHSLLFEKAVDRPRTDFTAGGLYPDVFENFHAFLTVSRLLEDLAVAAYKGQLEGLRENAGILTAAMRMHSVEARHAAEVRRIAGLKAWKDAFDEPMPHHDVDAALTPFLSGR